MNHDLGETCRQVVESAGQLAADVLSQRDNCEEFDRSAWDTCGKAGLLNLCLPQQWGGAGLDMLSTVHAYEALGQGGADRGLLFAMGAHLFGCAVPIARYGSDAQQEQFGKDLASGLKIAALAITEADGGSHTAKMATVAVADGDEFILNGQKALITNATVADVFLVIVSQSPKLGTMGLTAFLIPRDTDGLSVQAMEPTLGMHGAPVGRVSFNDCRVPADAVLGRPNGGWPVFLSAMQHERTCILAGFVGAAQRDLHHCVKYACQRKGPKGSAYDYQAVSHRLARTQCRLQAARALMHRGAQTIDHGKDVMIMPATVKLTVSETLVQCAMDVLEIYAGAGWVDQGGSATALRDVIGTLSASGTSNIQLELIASHLKQQSD